MSPLIPLGIALAALGFWLAFRLIRESRDRAQSRASYFDAVKPLFEQIDNLQLQARNAAQARDLLLPKLMSGLITV